MVLEVLSHDTTQEEVQEGIEGNKSFIEMDSKPIDAQALDESIASGLTDSSHETNELVKEVDNVPKADFLNDAGDEWPTPKQVHSFYFVKYRSFEDPKLKAKFEEADKELQKNARARVQITEQLKEKRSERSSIISQLKTLTAKDKDYRSMMDLKRKEMEPLQAALGELRSVNIAAREKGMGLCSSEEELDEIILSLHYRMQHESLTLVEEKQLIKEIKQLEGTREKVIANAARRAKIQDSLGHKEVIQGQVKLITGDIDGVRKEQQAVRKDIKVLENELNAIDKAISSLQQKLNDIVEKKNKAYETITELRKARDEANACYFQNRSLINSAKDLAAKKDLASLQGLSHNEMEKFMSHWIKNKAFREDYEKRILPSLDSRQLSRDGRMRNPDEKPITSKAPAPKEPDTTPVKASPKQAKEDVHHRLQHDSVPNHKQESHLKKSTEAESGRDTRSPEENINASRIEKPEKDSSKSNEIDAAQIKEIKREEEIAKAKMAIERKKKLAEKAAAKATIRAQKEAERKLKEKEKRAKKKAAGASTPASAAEETEMDTQDVEPEEPNVNNDYPIAEKSKEHKENVRFRTRTKGRDQIPRVIFKKKKSHSNWLWAIAPAAVAVLVLAMFGYYFSFVRKP